VGHKTIFLEEQLGQVEISESIEGIPDKSGQCSWLLDAESGNQVLTNMQGESHNHSTETLMESGGSCFETSLSRRKISAARQDVKGGCGGVCSGHNSNRCCTDHARRSTDKDPCSGGAMQVSGVDSSVVDVRFSNNHSKGHHWSDNGIKHHVPSPAAHIYTTSRGEISRQGGAAAAAAAKASPIEVIGQVLFPHFLSVRPLICCHSRLGPNLFWPNLF
jgi:hypothetical protein